MRIFILSAISTGSLYLGVSVSLAEEVSFNFDIRPIMSDTCFLCHGPDEGNREADLRFDIREVAIADRDGSVAIVPGDPEESLMIWMINSDDEEDHMPPLEHPRQLTEDEKVLFRQWIEQGAKYEKHWSLMPPNSREPVEVSDLNWVKNPIDRFVLKKMDEEGLSPSEEADRTTLIRRVTFDLTGLPPTLEEIDAFLADTSADADEKLVDDLLSRIAYAERLTNEWMDVARFSDSQGYSQDFVRDMSPYRDWVIEAFDSNMPFDQFAEWQLAGDLLPNATRTQKLATAFNRLHPQNTEGGIVNEEFKVEYAAERVQTFSAAFLGMTIECARCHDHKYDPITQQNFYELFSFFNNIDDSGQISYEASDMPAPTLMLPTVEQTKKLSELDRRIEVQEAVVEKNYHNSRSAFIAWKKREGNGSSDLSGEDALVGVFPLISADTTASIASSLNPTSTGRVIFSAQVNNKEGPDLDMVTYEAGVAAKVNGDDALYFPDVNFFRRATPFSVGIDANIPEAIEEGTLIHFNVAGILYNYKGWEVSLTDGHWDVRMAHNYPYNAIQLVSTEPVKKNVWQSVFLTYDGSSKAAGLTLYVDGVRVPMHIERDRLYKNILSNKEGVRKEVGLKVGARWRSKGLPGTLVDNVRAYDRKLTDVEVAFLAGRDDKDFDEDPGYDYFLNRYHEPYREGLKLVAELRGERNDLNEKVQEVMVMDEMPEPQQAYVLRRGSYDAPTKPVSPGTPEAILRFPDGLPNNRLGLAHWLTDPRNPLTARVTVNRYWQMIFGRGLVGTPEDFGNQGQLPTHPELLDWLAKRFVDSGWDVKALLRLMVTSATYTQSSRANASQLENDPENLLLARGPVVRLSAEMLRDNALAASGLLVDKVGGKSVYPYQPEGLWSMNKGTYEVGSGDDLYRRSLYTVWKRTVPPPTMKNFDAPNRSYCVVKRQNTSSPLQALSLMNDPQFVEASRALAERVMRLSAKSEERLILSYRLLTSRYPSRQELKLLENIFEQVLDSFKNKPGKADELLSVGESVPGESVEKNTLAAHAVLASLIMNHDASVVLR